MSTLIGREAVVVGAGIAGLTAARAIADYFEHVVVLERDALPADPADRAGVPQGRHVHALLAGGQQALCDLFPGFELDLAATDAVPLRVGLDVRVERPGYDPFPQRDLGLVAYSLSRAQLEFSVRRRLEACANVQIRPRCRVQAVVIRPDRVAVTGVRYQDAGGRSDTRAADLVVDASGQGAPTLGLLASIGQPPPPETTIGVDLGYASAVFAVPDEVPRDWKGVFCFARAPRTSRGGVLLPLEGRRWILTLAGRHGERPPRGEDAFMTFAAGLRTPTIHDALTSATRLSDIAHFGFPASAYRHYERLETFPRGLLPFGDAVCRFNPVYGQGMSVAAQEARALGRLLATRAAARHDPLEGLAGSFFAEASALIDTPWTMAAIPDFAYPETRGDRPANLAQTLMFARTLNKLASQDPAVHKLVEEVQHLLKPRSVLQDPELVSRVLAAMAAS